MDTTNTDSTRPSHQERSGLSRRAALRSVASGSLAALVIAASRSGTLVAQEATPAGIVGNELAPGVVGEVFGGAPSARAEGHTLYQLRITFQPGAAVFSHSHPGTVLFSVASGALGWTLVAGVAHVLRGSAAGATGPIEDLTEEGADVVLSPGDIIYYEDDVIHNARGAADEPSVVLVSLLLTSGEPIVMPADMEMGTPAN